MAETNVQQLLLRIDATTEIARQELRRMSADVDRFGTNAERSLNRFDTGLSKSTAAIGLLKSTLGGLAAGVGVSGLLAIGRGTLQFADDLEAAATQAGVAVERFQTLKEGLRALEVDGEKTDKILKSLNDTLGAVQSGTAAKGVTDALDRMGVTARILSGEITTTDGLLDAIAGSAKTFSTEAQFTSAVVDVLGKKIGVDLAAALRDGGTALKENEKAFRDTGAVITDEYIKRLADANETIDAFTTRSKARLTIWAAESISLFGKVGRFLSFQNFGIGYGAETGASPARTGTAPASPVQQGAEIVVTARRPSRSSGGRARSGPAALSDADLRLGGRSLDSGLPISADLTESVTLVQAFRTDLEAILPVYAEIAGTDIISEDDLRRAEQFNQDLSRGIADVIVYGESLGDVLTSTFKRAGAALLESGILSLIGGASSGGGIGGALVGGIKSLFSGKGFASGGRPPVGKFSLVGENGPEMRFFDTPSTIVPFGSGGGGGMVVNVDARGATDPGMVEMAARRGAALAMAQSGDAMRQITRPKMRGARG